MRELQIQTKNIYTNKTNHFDIGCLGKSTRDADEEGGENEKRSEIHGDNGPESVDLEF